jgi:hypothetical protein
MPVGPLPTTPTPGNIPDMVHLVSRKTSGFINKEAGVDSS